MLLSPSNVHVGDVSGFAVVTNIEYKPAVKGFHIHWLTTKGIKIKFIAEQNLLDIDRLHEL